MKLSITCSECGQPGEIRLLIIDDEQPFGICVEGGWLMCINEDDSRVDFIHRHCDLLLSVGLMNHDNWCHTMADAKAAIAGREEMDALGCEAD